MMHKGNPPLELIPAVTESFQMPLLSPWKPQLARCASKLSKFLREQYKPDWVTISIANFANWHVHNLLYVVPLYFCKPACTKFTLCVSFLYLLVVSTKL
jgi:hypothetical protein